MKILLVEDDEQQAELFKQSLQEQRYVVDITADGQEAWELIESSAYDLILLDVMLPKLDGVSLCRRIRSQGNSVPVLLLTARGTSDDKVMGLDAGADDYLVKPIGLKELAARIRALLRRGRSSASPVLEWGNLRLDPSSCKVVYGDRLVPLTPKEYALLELFLRNHQRVFSRSAILDQLWSYDDELPGEDTVKAHIKGLRHKLKGAGAADLVETVYGLGYRLNPTYLKEKSKDAPQPQAAAKDQDKRQQSRDRVAKLWQQSKPKILERIGVLENAIASLLNNPLNKEAQTCVEQESHKLAGTLGMYGIPSGSQLARQIEEAVMSEGSPVLEQISSCQHWAVTLREQVEQFGADFMSSVSSSTGQIKNPKPGNHTQQKPRLLIVDDDQELSQLLVSEATAWEMQATIATSPSAARDAIHQARPDVVLLDLSFSDKDEDGLALLAESTQQTPPLPVLVFTSSYQFTDRVAVARLKGKGFLQKPTTPNQVMEAVTHVLEQVKSTESKILAVDDDPVTLKVLQSLLKPWGLNVTTLQDPAQLWDTLEAVTPDLLVLDVSMPEVSGIDLCQTLRNDPRWSWLPVLFLTANPNPETIHQVFSAGADDYASKPIVAPELVTRIINRLERTRILRSQVETDSLTGATNRQTATQDLSKLLPLAKRSQQPLCLAVLELDNLKHLNQQYGHGMGDKALRHISQLLRQELRHEDLVARWSGAEFVVGMYGMSRSDGVEWLAEILETLRQIDLQPDDTHNAHTHITFSAGIAQYPDDGATVQMLYEAAGSVLLQAKQAGGDRVLPVGWQPALPQSSSTDVVLVHPDPTFANLVLQALQTRGYSSQWLDNGQLAMDRLAGASHNLHAQIVLLSTDLPGVSGLTVLKQLVRSKITRSSQVILLSSQLADAEKAVQLGAFDYVITPCKLSVLMQRLRCSLAN